MVAYYEDKTSETRLARTVVVIAPDDRTAVQMVKTEIAPLALGGRVAAIHVVEKEAIEPKVVFQGDPYIPFRWPVGEGGAKTPGDQA
mgnify:CR=1 FL=1